MATVRATKNLALIAKLHKVCFPCDPIEYGHWNWVAYEGKTPIGFSSLRHVDPKTLFLSRAGVIPSARGKGLHRRLIDARIRWARRHGKELLITYTTSDNVSSANNLIWAGFSLYSPQWPWVGPSVLYWRKAL